MTSPDAKLQRATELVQRFVPEFDVKNKSDSRLQRLIGWLFSLIGNNDYSEDFWTTVKKITYRPTTSENDTAWYDWQTVLHEGWHGVQWTRKRWWMLVSYLLPQALGAIAIVLTLALAPVIGWSALWCLAGLAFFAPIPSYWRSRLEYEAHQVSVAIDHWTWGKQPPNFPQWLVDRYAGPSYWWMWPFKKAVRKHFQSWAQSLEDGTWEEAVEGDPRYHAFLRACRNLSLEYGEN